MGYQDYINLSVEDELIERKEVSVVSEYDKQNDFSLESSGRRYDRQFFTMYQARLNELKTRVDSRAMKQWGNGTIKRDNKVISKVDKILNITSNQLCWVSGTIFVDLKNKLNIFNDVEKGIDDVLPQIPKSYISSEGTDDKVIMLEDESGRAILHGDDKLKDQLFVTGAIVAVLGIELQAGIFEMIEIIHPEIAPIRPMNPKSNSKIAFVSGLEISDSVNYDFKIDLLKEFFQNNPKSKDISHLVIAGNSIKETDQDIGEEYVSNNNYGSKNISKFNDKSLKLFEVFINEIISNCNISIMPGPSDPTDICLPQQPLHRSFFVNNKNYVGNNIRSLTNPSWLEIDSIRMLGTSGQNIDDIVKYLSPEDLQNKDILLKIMKSTINWQNIAPTAPDTLYCYPFENNDPFTLTNETPKVYFIGNQNEFKSELVNVNNENMLLLTIPKFNQCGQLVLLDTVDLSVEIIKFET
ncbi:DNA polymerase delta small subunit [[Candida] jaroonii]|uniref:DNA polymerase delta small subunit n=1 Tax=[Candida] jaroonii TaxID=467808 RepID=A0ACA9YAB8_9ASCO|nr:DNA polymerase delta small subunit [[Candida] jaroonii]